MFTLGICATAVTGNRTRTPKSALSRYMRNLLSRVTRCGAVPIGLLEIVTLGRIGCRKSLLAAHAMEGPFILGTYGGHKGHSGNRQGNEHHSEGDVLAYGGGELS